MSIAALRETVAASPPLLLSVDIFDTLLLRGTKPEFARFREVASWQDRALGPASPGAAALLAARLSVTRRAYAAIRADGGPGEVRFTAILADICGELAIDPVWVPKLEKLEVEYETTVLAANRALAAELKRLSAAGIPLIATSDTPLSVAAVTALLTRFHPDLSFAHIYASSDLGRTKRVGTLYDHLCESCQVPPGQILHMGDHSWSDVAMPRQRGLRAVHLPRPAPWRWLHACRHGLIRRSFRLGGLIP